MTPRKTKKYTATVIVGRTSFTCAEVKLSGESLEEVLRCAEILRNSGAAICDVVVMSPDGEEIASYSPITTGVPYDPF